MMNRAPRWGFFLLSVLIVCSLLTSCVNTPGKVAQQVGQNASAGVNESPEGDSAFEEGLSEDSANLEIVPDSFTGPTVTPIILPALTRGIPQRVVTRAPTGLEVDGEWAEASDGVGAVNAVMQTPTPAVVESLSDQVKVYSFQPIVGATLLPGQAFNLNVTLYNAGTTTWQTTYKVIDVSANPMSVEQTHGLPMAVAPGGTALLTITMTAPKELGTYAANFVMEDAYGVRFGSFDWGMKVGEYTSATEIATLTPSVTPTYYSAEGITATPDTLAWMCVDPERSKLQDCYQFCTEYPDTFPYCFYDGNRYTTPVP